MLFDTNGGVLGVAGNLSVRAILLDLGSVHTALITIERVDPAQFDAFVAEAMPLIQSFHFK